MTRRVKVGLIVLAGVTAPYWLMALFIGWHNLRGKVDEIRYASTTQFDSAKWKSPNLKYRYAVLNTVGAKVITGGMSEPQVMQLLGKPDLTDTNNNWQYETTRPGWRLIDWTGGGLLVCFTTNRVVIETKINTWID